MALSEKEISNLSNEISNDFLMKMYDVKNLKNENVTDLYSIMLLSSTLICAKIISFLTALAHVNNIEKSFEELQQELLCEITENIKVIIKNNDDKLQKIKIMANELN